MRSIASTAGVSHGAHSLKELDRESRTQHGVLTDARPGPEEPVEYMANLNYLLVNVYITMENHRAISR